MLTLNAEIVSDFIDLLRAKFKQKVDALFVLDNDEALKCLDESFKEAGDELTKRALIDLNNLISNMEGLINED